MTSDNEHQTDQCPRCGAGPGACHIGPAPAMADLTEGTRVIERYGPRPQAGTVKELDHGDLSVLWDDGRAAFVSLQGPPSLSNVLLRELELAHDDQVEISTDEIEQPELEAG